MFFKKSRLWKSEKRQRSGPLEKNFFFVSDFDETQNLKSLWPRDFTHEIWAESEPKIFLTYTLASGQNIRGDLWWRGCFWCLWKAKDHNIYLETNFGHLEVIWYIYRLSRRFLHAEKQRPNRLYVFKIKNFKNSERFWTIRFRDF